MASSRNNTSTQEPSCVASYGEWTVDDAVLPVAMEIPQGETNAARELQNHREYMAFAIPQDGTSAVANDSPHYVKIAELRGIIANEEEREATQKANRQVFSKDYFINQAVQEANQRAKIRDAQGLQIDSSDRLITSHGNSSNTEEQQTSSKEHIQQASIQNVQGYQVKEYRMSSDYDTKDYKIQEYRSVYD